MSNIETLQRRKREAEKRADLAKVAVTRANAELAQARQDIKTLEIQIDDAVNTAAEQCKTPRISDHALIRYLERKHDFSFEDLRRQILTPEREQAIRSGAKSIVHDGLRFIVNDMTIVTVAPDSIRAPI